MVVVAAGEQAEDEVDAGTPSSENRAGEFRWLDERRAALETCTAYWKTKNANKENDDDGRWGFVVWAGLEPTEFKAIFPQWKDNAEAKELNEQVRLDKELENFIEKQK